MLHMYLGSQLKSAILENTNYCNFFIRRTLMTTVTLHFYANWNRRISEVKRDPS